MRKTIFILMAIFVMTCLILSATAQHPAGRILIMDETEYAPSGSSGFRIITSNDSVYYYLTKDFLNKGKSFKLIHTKKKDRSGDYWEHTFYFKNDYYNDIVTFVNSGKGNRRK